MELALTLGQKASILKGDAVLRRREDLGQMAHLLHSDHLTHPACPARRTGWQNS